jgi:RNA 3'-terminal phosphate cyclase (ATP)
MQEIGFQLSLELGAAGFGPEGGGEATLAVRGFGAARPFDRRARGMLNEVRVLSTVSGLPLESAVAQSERAVQRLKESGIVAEAENIPVPASRSRGSMCLVVATFERSRAGFAAVGAPEDDPRAIGERAADACVDFIRSHGAVDVTLAERLLIPMAALAARSTGKEHRLFRCSIPRLSEGMLSIAELPGARVNHRYRIYEKKL